MNNVEMVLIEAQARIKQLEIELSHAEQRLGPEGFKIIDRVKELRRERNELRKSRSEYMDIAEKLSSELDATRARLAQMEKCPNESWECAKEARTLTLERDSALTRVEKLRAVLIFISDDAPGVMTMVNRAEKAIAADDQLAKEETKC